VPDTIQLQSRQGRSQFHSDIVSSGKGLVVVGSGTSRSVDLPVWKTLVSRLADRAGIAQDSTDDNTSFAERIRNKIEAKSPGSWPREVYNALYKDASLTQVDLLKGRSLQAAVALIMCLAKHPGGTDVISFNFDDVLERALRMFGGEVSSVAVPDGWYEPASIRVWHPHGLLPFKRPNAPEGRLVLDRFSFATAGSTQEGLWSSTLLALLRRRYAFLIGLSGDDDNLDRFLADCAASHPAYKRTSYWGTVFLQDPTPSAREFWDRRRVLVETFTDFDNDLPARLLEIAQPDY
jgi:hypothetical protein